MRNRGLDERPLRPASGRLTLGIGERISRRMETMARVDRLGRDAVARNAARTRKFHWAWFAILSALIAWAAPSYAAPGSPKWGDVHYGPDPRQTFDLWSPNAPGGAAPVVIVFHPGGFIQGDKHPCLQKFIDKALSRGIAVACANYRLAPQALYPAPMMDGARAVQWIRHYHAEFGIDPDRIAVAGLSAGGAIALWIAFNPDLADAHSSDAVSRESTRVVAVVTSNAQATYDPKTIASVFQTRQLPQFLADLFGAGSVEGLLSSELSENERKASPVEYIHAAEPPALVYYTADESPLAPDSPPQDYIHNPAQGRLLERTAQERGARIEFHAGHDYPAGWDGFLDAAANFLAANFHHQ
jgi:acetyl esterase/lipase